MANIMDYLDWRGDLNFKQSEFNDVDNLILAQLSYVNFDNIIEGIDSLKSISIKDASHLFFQIYDEKEVLSWASMTKMTPFLMKKMSESKRFKDLKLSKYVNRIDLVKQKQFSAITIELDKNTIYISYRGTDDTIIGWKENFNMSFMSPVPAQLDAVEYLEHTAEGHCKNIILGGHSKGGNLSVYAGVNCCSSIKNRIIAVYNNDGPGFDREIIDSKEYRDMLSRIKTIVPQSSIVGMLLEHEEEYEIVKSSQNGIMQHDALSWEVLGTNFVCVDNVSKRSKFLDATFKTWVNNIEKDQREQFIETLFYVFEVTNVKNLGDLSHDKLKKIHEILKVINNMSPENKEILYKTIRMLFKESNRAFRDFQKDNWITKRIGRKVDNIL